MVSLKDSLTEEELDKAKRHLKGNMILGLESTNSRMNNIARQEIYFGRYISPDEISKAVEMVSLKQLKELSERLTSKKMLSITAYGPLQKDVLDGIF
jgi:predicted Zn-dependent peptidase